MLRHPPVKNKVRPIPHHLQSCVEKDIKKLMQSRHFEKTLVEGDCLVSPVAFSVKEDISMKYALGSKKIKDSCIKTRPHLPNNEEILHQVFTNIIRIQFKRLLIANLNLEYA